MRSASPVLETPATLQDATARFMRGPAPNWVEQPALPAPPAQPDAPTTCLLLDEQFDLRGAPAQRYVRLAHAAHNDSGVEHLSELHILFNPAYETLTLHWVRLVREGETLDALQDADVELMRHERDMYARVYRGDYLVLVQVRGVRPGDVLDYAYTITGQNPVYGGGFDFGVRHAFPQPVTQRLCRVLRDPSGPVEIHERGPQTAHRELPLEGGGLERRLEQRDVAAAQFEYWVPSDAPPQAGSWTFTTFRDWAHVAAWSASLYAFPPAEDPALAGLLAELRQAPDPALAAIAYVQERLRYVAANYGEGGYRPRALEVIVGRGYGDCKDKCYLLCALLRGLGLRAEVALVDSAAPLGPLVAAPSPAAFDHVIVRLEQNDGAVHWIDATATAQRGPLAKRWRPHSMAALVARAGVDGLELLAPLPEGVFGDRSQAMLDLRAGPGRPVLSSDVSISLGRDAENLRRRLKALGLQGLQKQFLEAASESHGAAEYELFEVEDEEAENRLTIRSRIRYADPWREAPGGVREFRDVLCYATQLLPQIPMNGRRLPVRLLEHPLHHRHAVSVLLPKGLRPLDLRGAAARRNEAFAFERTERYTAPDRLDVVVDTRTLGPHLPAERALQALRDQTALQDGHVLSLRFGRRRLLGGLIRSS